MTNDGRNDVIRAVNASLHGLPEAIRSISADYEPGLLRLQFIHDGELDEPVRVAIDTIEERVASVLPNIYDAEQLREFAEASDKAPLSAEEIERVQALVAANFGQEREEGKFKGTMELPAELARA